MEELLKMKSTGIVRRIDEVGRLVLPIELRRTMNFNIKDPIEIFVDGATVILKKYEPCCIFCSDSESIVEYMGKNVCRHCLAKLAAK